MTASSISSYPTTSAGLIFSPPHSSNYYHSAKFFKWGLRSGQEAKLVTRNRTTRGRAFLALANSNVSRRKREPKKEAIMVDPLEAKRLASKQMEEIKAKEKLKRRRRIEAINGAWAMIGLTAGLIIEGHTGNSIPSQLTGYLDAIVHFFVR